MMKSAIAALAALVLAAGQAAAQTGSLTMHLVNARTSKDLLILVNRDETRSSVEVFDREAQSRMRLITDSRMETATTLIDKTGSKKVGLVNKLAPSPRPAATGKPPAKPKITETKETRTIHGKACRKVECRADSVTAVLWLAPDTTFRYSDLLSLLSQPYSPAFGYIYNLKDPGKLDGFPMEITAVPDASPADSTTVTILNLRSGVVNEKAFSTDGFEMYDRR